MSATIVISYHKIISSNIVDLPDDIHVESIKLEKQDDDNADDRIIKTLNAQEIDDEIMAGLKKA